MSASFKEIEEDLLNACKKDKVQNVANLHVLHVMFILIFSRTKWRLLGKHDKKFCRKCYKGYQVQQNKSMMGDYLCNLVSESDRRCNGRSRKQWRN